MSENGNDVDRNKRSTWQSWKERLTSSTNLALKHGQSIVPSNVLLFFRSLADPSKDDPELQNINNPYKYAKMRLNKIWAGRDAYKGTSQDQSPVAQLTTFRGAVTSYFTGENWKQAAIQTGAVAGLATLSAANVVWVAEAYANVLNTASMMSNPEVDSVSSELTSALGNLLMLGGIQAGSAWSMVKMTGLMQKDIALSIKRRFKDAAFEEPDILHRIAHNKEDETAPDFMPDNPHQRMNDAADQFAGGVTRLTTDVYVAALTSAFVGIALYQNSVPIEALNGLGEQLNTMFPNAEVDFKEKGTFAAAIAVIGAYLGVTIPKGISISEKIKNSYKDFQKHSANITDKFVKAIDNSEAIAASKGHKSADEALEESLKELDASWRDENNNFARYIMFMQSQSFIGHNLIAFLPSFASTFGENGIMSTANPVQSFFESQALVSALLASMSQVVYILPEYARMKGQADRINEMAQMFEQARDKKAFYSLSGIHEFEEWYLDSEDEAALKISGLELMFRGKEDSFLKAPDIRVDSGDWVHVKAPSGAGKSCMMRSIAGIWPHGRGSIAKHENAQLFYAHQVPDLSGANTLQEHVIYGMPDASTHEITPMRKEKMKAALQEAGLGDLVDNLNDTGSGGKSWESLLSGGQKQRLVLARILYQEPDIILLDEATSALDPEAKENFFDKLNLYSGNATIIAITHDENTPRDASGEHYFNKRIHIQDGVASIESIDEHEPNHTLEAMIEMQ